MSEARSFTAMRRLTGVTWDIRPFDATDDLALRTFWDEGLSVVRISVALGRTKSSVVGRVHRLKLTPRPSPILRKPTPGAHHSATEPAHGARVAPPAPTPPPSPPASPPTDQVPEQLPPAVRPNLTPPAAFPTFRTCQYPRGSRPHWDWCSAPVVPGRPYCLFHEKLCWISPPRHRQEAA